MLIELGIVFMNTNRLNCIITGANGYLGSNLVTFLKKEWNIVEFVRNPKKKNQVQYRIDKIPDIKFFKNVELIIHTAYDKSDHFLNIKGYKKLIKKAKKANVRKIIHISSISSFKGCISEYGKTKLSMEKITINNNGINLRSGLIYGNQTKGILGVIKKKMKDKKIIPVLGDGKYEVYLTNIEFIYREILKANLSNKSYTKVLITTKKIQFIELLKKISEYNQYKNIFIFMPWRIVYYQLKIIEMLNINLSFKSDNILGLITPLQLENSCIKNILNKEVNVKDI